MVSSIHYPATSLKPHRDESLLTGHLWIFSGALQQTPHWVEAGGLLDVKSSTGQFLARGYYNPRTDIAIRILTRDQEEVIDAAFFQRRIANAQALRRTLDPHQTNAYRLIHAEGDGLPGLVVDRYADILVAQIDTLGMERLFPQLIEPLMQETGAHGLLVRNDSQLRRREGMEVEDPVVMAGEVPSHVRIIENGVQFQIDPWHGQKTGFYLDQRDKRASVRKYAQGNRVLNCFCYTGGFSLYAALADPETHTTSVDISATAIEAAREHFTLNGLQPEAHRFFKSDVFEYLEEAQRTGEQFDVLVVDPPAFARTQATRPQALKAYRRLNTLAMQVLRQGGIMLTCSCSGVIGMDDIMGSLSLSAQRLHRTVQVLETYTHGFDHPINLVMPETAYLKAVFCRVI